ncbi:MAG: amylo-alpha-1,6-glucosidase, partial [Myxococcota bacterium]
GQPRFNKDAAYHNGTVWGWNAGFTVTGLARYGYSDHAYDLSRSLTDQILNRGTRGSMSEVLDAHPPTDGDFTLSGTFSQAWSVSEFARNAYQDYLGVRPNLPERKVDVWLSPPAAWTRVQSDHAMGSNQWLNLDFVRSEDRIEVSLALRGANPSPVDVSLLLLDREGDRHRAIIAVADGEVKRVQFNRASTEADVDGDPLVLQRVVPSQTATVGVLRFVQPNTSASFPALQTDDYLERLIEQDGFE